MHEQDARTPGSVHEYTFAPRRSTHADDPVPFLVQNKPWWEQYSWAVHNTVSLMMTNSYGLAQKTGLLVEEWIQVIGMFCGALWQALLLGYGANLLAHKDYTKNMQEVEEFMSYYDLPERLRARIRSHLNAQAMFLNDKDILSSLSGTLRETRKNGSLERQAV
ncbi:hypothetical protein MTO96_020503 [Rhipicephalus appendiculatus]